MVQKGVFVLVNECIYFRLKLAVDIRSASEFEEKAGHC